MANLQCSVSSCAHNDTNGYCCKQSINVRGVNAKSSSNTRCNSFAERTSSYSNCVNNSNSNYLLDINCTAKNCIHNNANSCFAPNVSIDNSDKGTECTSFKVM